MGPSFADVAYRFVMDGVRMGLFTKKLLPSLPKSLLLPEKMGIEVSSTPSPSPPLTSSSCCTAAAAWPKTLNREFLLRVSYLEIYNEVVNDLLNPAGKNLRIREDLQGTFVEGIKEEVVLSPTHVLSLIAAGEEHRHIGSTNFNLLSSRSHTIF
uniref:Kinesin motor domain-containing protein n=2 Tax=Aegilops tauschii subsp. strangulata TaxID=200361 RepID=A0A453R217_AEGTS